jgi:hypothetical protein
MSRSLVGDRHHGPDDDIVDTRATRPLEREAAAHSVAAPEAVLLRLQASAGNAAVMQLLRARPTPTAQLMPSIRRHPLPPAAAPPTAPIIVARQTDESAGPDEDEGAPEQVITGTTAEGETEVVGAGSADESSDLTAGAGAVGDEATEGEGAAAGADAASVDSAAGAGGEAAEGEGGETADAEAAEERAGDGAEGEGVEAGEDGEQEHSADEQAEKQAEGEAGSESDERVPAGGGAFPIAAASTGPVPVGRFVNGGRAGTVPFTEAQLDVFDPERDQAPHAFAAGGRTGTKAWAGGGGAGPKGNQQAGSIQNQVEPVYDSEWGGLFSNANAWVRDGTGIADVTRNYVTSNPGDQGNGWWISDKAASALEAHEQRHVANSKEQYENSVQPVLDRIANSRSLGANKTYKSVDARQLLKRQIGWKDGIQSFVDADQSYNAPNMMVDTNDLSSGALPRPQHGPRKIGGKDYDNYLIMSSEPDPT